MTIMGKDRYFEYLMGLFDNGQFDDDTMVYDFSRALELMHNTPFKIKIALDENRLDDVRVYLRDPYPGDKIEYMSHRISILEVLMATLMRFCESIGDRFNGEELPAWDSLFWDALYNMGIVPNYDNENILYSEYSGANLMNNLSDILHSFNERTYATDGTGGPFPLKSSAHFSAQNCVVNQRELDLFHLVNLYVGEKFDFYA